MHPSSAAWPPAKLRLDLDELNAVSGSSVAVEQQKPRRQSLRFSCRGPDRYAIDLKIESFGIGLGLASRRLGLALPAKRRSVSGNSLILFPGAGRCGEEYSRSKGCHGFDHSNYRC
jgi:hypothetical protein